MDQPARARSPPQGMNRALMLIESLHRTVFALMIHHRS
jgi:hypothetical protein